jgi:beta-mannosidase
MLPQFASEAGFAELLQLKTWIETIRKVSPSTKHLMKLGTAVFKFLEKHPSLKKFQGIFMEWGMKKGQTTERSIYQNVPLLEKTPLELQHARQVWQAWQFHNAQLMETFENGISTGNSLDDFIANSQAYQAHLVQFGTECYRRAKYTKVTGILQFDFTDPWPAVTWSVLDYWRHPKLAFDALRRSMQPVLPSFCLPENIESRKAIPALFCVVNDLVKAFPEALCNWQLSSKESIIAAASFPVNVPADGISREVKVTLPSLGAGQFMLNVTLSSGRNILGENCYEVKVDDPDNKRRI